MSKFLEQAIKAQAERIRNLEKENRNLKAKIKELEKDDTSEQKD